MADGVTAELNELISLRRYAQSVQYQPEMKALRSGTHLSKLRGRGMDFAEVRNYQAGDEIRHMEWRVTARTGRPHVKIYQEERERPVVILADFNPSMIFMIGVQVRARAFTRVSEIPGFVNMNSVCFQGFESPQVNVYMNTTSILGFSEMNGAIDFFSNDKSDRDYF